MSDTGQSADDQARQILRSWLTAQNRSIRNLAQEAGIQPSVVARFQKGETTLEASSALKLYSVLQQTMNPFDRRSFIESLGLLPLASAFSRDALFTIDMTAPPYEVGSRLMVAGFDLAKQAANVEAMPLFRAAEEMFGKASSQAAFAACMMTQMYINLGDYPKAQEEADRIQNTYRSVMDPEIRAELYRIRNWLDYYQGNYPQAAQWLRKRIKIGKAAGIVRLTNPHFLGRMYYDRGCLQPNQQEADQLFAKAEQYFDQSYQIHLNWGDEHSRAFDLFRKAQALQMQRKWSDAKKLRTRAHEMFMSGSVGGLLHIELEEAKLLLENGEIEIPKRKAEEVLRGWEQVKYRKGIGDTLKVLGDLAYMQGDLESTLEIFVARLCIYPYDNYPSTQQVWEEVKHLQREMLLREGRAVYQEMLQPVVARAEHRQGYFSYLDTIVTDSSADLARVVGSLQSPLP